MTRPQPLRRTGRQRTRYADAATIDAYRWAHERCAACHRPHWHPDVWSLDVHHLFGGRLCRPDAAWGVLLLCRRYDQPGCHWRLDHSRENLAVCLTMKAELGEYEPAACQAWLDRFGEILPEPAELPAWVLNLRNNWSER